MGVLSFVKSNCVQLRWAPANASLWKAGNAYGYRIERVSYDQYTKYATDSLRFKNAVIANNIIPWKQADERWKALADKNKTARLLFSSLYAAESKASPQKKEMLYALLMKSCDLYKELALAAGITYTDSTLEAGQKYMYRISLSNSPNTMKHTSAIILVNTQELNFLQNIKGLKAGFSDRKAVLSFATLHTKDYSGYWIERSEDSINYVAVNKTPFIRSTTKYDESRVESLYQDSLPQNHKKYFYRVRGISYFGEMGPPSNVVSGIGRPALREYPAIDSATVIKNSAVTINFHMPASFNKRELLCFYILRCGKRAGAYKRISGSLNPSVIQYTDELPLESNYYKICAISIYGDSVFSMIAYAKLIDETPPATPASPIGTIDSNGVVKINWAINTEKDLLGYRVYRCNSLYEQPVELTKKILIGNSFRDSISLRTLTKEVYYSVRAVDKVYNNSAYSKPCKLMRPDKIAPVAIVFGKISSTDSSFILNWHNSSSNDVKKYELWRKENAAGWQLIKIWNASERLNSFTDMALLNGNTYQYKMEVEDESGYRSATESYTVLFKPVFLPKIKNLQVKVSRERRNIELSWNSSEKNIFNYTLYKAKAGGPLQVFKTLPAGSITFTDKELYPNNKYRYAIKATYNSGTETALSDALEVEF